MQISTKVMYQVVPPLAPMPVVGAQVFVIDKEGELAYSGAIDDDKSVDEVGGTNFLKNALDAVLEGEVVETPRTDPYGAPIE